MHGGDSLFGRMTSTTHVYRDSGIVDSELDHKTRRVTEKLSDSINTIANEPSVAFYRIQEHVRKTLPQLVELKHEVEEVQQQVQGSCFDTEYAGNAVKGMEKSVVHFQNIQDLLKNSMFIKQQIDYEEVRRRQGRPLSGASSGGGGAPRQEGPAGATASSRAEEEGSNPMEDSAVSTDSSLGASAQAASEVDSFEELEETNNETDSAERGKDVAERQEQTEGAEKNKDLAKRSPSQTYTPSTTESKDRLEQRPEGEREDRERERDAENKEETELEGDRQEEKRAEREKDETQNVLEESDSSTDTIQS